jgi:hypothetical protein
VVEVSHEGSKEYEVAEDEEDTGESLPVPTAHEQQHSRPDYRLADTHTRDHACSPQHCTLTLTTVMALMLLDDDLSTVLMTSSGSSEVAACKW